MNAGCMQANVVVVRGYEQIYGVDVRNCLPFKQLCLIGSGLYLVRLFWDAAGPAKKHNIM